MGKRIETRQKQPESVGKKSRPGDVPCACGALSLPPELWEEAGGFSGADLVHHEPSGCASWELPKVRQHKGGSRGAVVENLKVNQKGKK